MITPLDVQSHRDTFLNTDASSRKENWLRAANLNNVVHGWKIESPEEATKWYQQLLNRSEKELTMPIKDQIHRDLHRSWCVTLTAHQTETLNNVLCSYATLQPDIHYCQGMNFLACVALHVVGGFDNDDDDAATAAASVVSSNSSEAVVSSNSSEAGSNALQILIMLIDRFASEYFSVGLVGVQVDLRVLTELLAIHLPEVATVFESCSVPVDIFCTDMIMCLMVHKLPLNCLLVLWDAIITMNFDCGSSSMLFASLLHFFDLHKQQILSAKNDAGLLMDEMKLASSQYEQSCDVFQMITGTLQFASKINSSDIVQMRMLHRQNLLKREESRLLRLASWEQSRNNDIMFEILHGAKLRISVLSGIKRLENQHASLYPSTLTCRRTMTLAGKEAIQCLETWMLHLSKKVDQASTEPWDDALSWEREKIKNDMGKKRDEENATLGGKLMLFVKMLPELVAHKSGETKQSTEDKEEAEARLTLTHRVKSMNTEEMVLSEILRDVDEALKSSSPSLTTATTADAATSTATSTATSASVCIALPQHVSSSIEQFRNTTSQALASVPTLLWIDPILALLDQKAARPYIAALFVLTRLQSENSAHGIAARLPQNVRHLFSEAITKLCLQLRNWLQHNLDVTQHRLFDQSFRSLLLRCERESFSLLSLEHGTEQNGAISMLSCLRANSSLLHQVCAHVKQSVGIRFIILLQLCEHIEKQMYMETLREERTRRCIDSVLVICQEADSLVERVGTYGSGGGGGGGGGCGGSGGCGAAEVLFVERVGTTVRAPTIQASPGESKAKVEVAQVVETIVQAPIVDHAHAKLLMEIQRSLRELSRCQFLIESLRNQDWKGKLAPLVHRTVVRVQEAQRSL